MEDDQNVLPEIEKIHQKMISSFITKIASSSRQLARRFLEDHQWEIDAAVSAFNEVVAASASARRNVTNPSDSRTQSSNLGVYIPAVSSLPPIRLRSPRSPPPSRRARNPFSRDKEHEAAAEESDDIERAPLPSSLSVGQKFRSVSDILSVIPLVIPRTVTVWRNGFVLDSENTLSTFDNPGNAMFLEVIESLESPRVFDSPDGKQRFLIKLIRRQQEDFPDPVPFQGLGRTLAEQNSVPTELPASSDSLPTEATPTIDPTAPTTTIKIILADGTPIVSRFNTNLHTIRDVRGFIDAATPDAAASIDYHLLIMGRGSPPTPLTTDLDQTIDQAGISNAVLTQKF